MFTDRQTDNPIFYKVETYLDRLLVPEIRITPTFVKIVRTVVEIYERCAHRQEENRTGNSIFYVIETHLDRLLGPEIRITPTFVKIVREVLNIYESCVYRNTGRHLDFLQRYDLSRSSSRVRNICNTEFCENL